MSSNLDLVRSIYASWERGDWGANDWADPGIEFVVADGPDPRSITGKEAMAAEWRAFLTAWSDYTIFAEDYRELDEHRVLVRLTAAGRGKSSGVEISSSSVRGANIFEIEAGRVKRLTIYFDLRGALADLGIEEPGDV
jgi:hypothetical protein